MSCAGFPETIDLMKKLIKRQIYKIALRVISKTDRYLYHRISVEKICRQHDYDLWKLREKIKTEALADKQLYLTAYDHLLEKHGSHIGYDARLEDIPTFPHGLNGIFINNGAKIGKNCVIFHQVTIGSNTLIDSKFAGAPDIGSNCYIGAGAKIIGGIRIADNCRIGANAVVAEDVPENSVVVQTSCVLERNGQPDNRFYTIYEIQKNQQRTL